MGLDFNTTPPTPISGQTNSVDNTTSISDASGALLFYSNGSTVWNKNNVIMPNGSGLTSNFSAGQCALIVPIPSSNKYVIFSNTEFASPGQLHYTVVDMSLNSGLGDVVTSQKNISLGTGWTEKLCAYYNSNCNYYWVLMHKWNNNQFVALKVDATGVTTTSVVSNVGSVLNCGSYGAAHDAMGQLTISKDGQKVVNALTCQDKFELFDFDINTGLLSNFILIPGNGGNAWGTGFSADSKKLYVNSIFGSQIFQYDLSTYNTTAIVASKLSIYNTGTGGYNFGYMELGPDNKMYIPRPSTSFFSIINSPNNIGAAASFSYAGLSVAPYTTTHGISRIAYNIGLGSSSGTISSSTSNSNVLCFGASTASASVIVSTPGTYSYLWSPGNYTTATVSNLSAGNYTVSISDGACNTNTTSVTITQPSSLTSSLTATSYSVCKNQSVTLNSIVSGGTPSYSVNWNTGATNTSSISISPSVTSVYSYTVTDANLCTKIQTLSISVQNPIANFSVATTPCSGVATFTNMSTGSSTYNWTLGNGNNSSSLNLGVQTFTASGIYTVQLNSGSSLGCLDSIVKTISITVPSTVSMSQTSSSILCYGGSSSATVNPAGVGPFAYSWSSLTNTTSVANNLLAGTYTVNVVSPSCETGSLVVNISQPSQLNSTLTATSYTVCENSSTSLITANIGGTPSYSVNWNTGAINTNSITITPAVTSIYTYTLTDSNSCTKTQSVQINVESTLAGFINTTPSCNSLISFTNTSTNNANSFWDFGDGQTSNSNSVISNNYTSSGIYTVSLVSTTINGCKDTIEQVVNVNANFLNLDFDYSIKTSKCKDSLFFVNNSQGATSYIWNFGDGNTSTQISPTHSYSSGVFSVTLVGVNANCMDSILQEITINDSFNSSDVNTPNVFTPNGDGANDVFDFKVMSKCEGFTFEIFDRWGLSIFKVTDGKQTYWDGRTSSGKEVTDGTYFYIMNIESGNKLNGTVTIFR